MRYLKLFFLVLILCLSSCAPKFSTAFFYTDYSKYTQQGFFITESNSAPFDYNPVGSIFIRQKAGKMSDVEILSQNVKEPKGYDELYGDLEMKRSVNNIKRPSDDSVLQAAFEFAKSQNADGIINISFKYYLENGRECVIFQGMLIKRK